METLHYLTQLRRLHSTDRLYQVILLNFSLNDSQWKKRCKNRGGREGRIRSQDPAEADTPWDVVTTPSKARDLQETGIPEFSELKAVGLAESLE